MKTKYKGEKVGMYVCGVAKDRGKAYCDSHALYADKLNEMFISAVAEWRTIKTDNDKIIEIEKKLDKLKVLDLELANLYNSRYISKLNYEFERKQLAEEMTQMERELQTKSQANILKVKRLNIEDVKYELVDTLLYRIEILGWKAKFIFKNGIEITRQWQNSPSGNKVGWKTKNQINDKEQAYGS